MRRLVALLVLALVGAVLYGHSDSSSGVSVNGVSVGASTLRSEMAVIATTPTIQCYLSAIDPVNFGTGSGGDTMTATAAAGWANLRVEGAAISQYVEHSLRYVPTSAQLASAKLSLEGELTQAALAKQFSCPGTAATALALMPSEMSASQIRYQADSLYLISRLNATIPLTESSMQMYFDSHRANYATICISVALVAPSEVAAFDAAQSSGQSVAQLAAKYSLDPSRTKGGAYGCYSPTSSSYATVRAGTSTAPLGMFPHTPQYINNNGSTLALFVAATKRVTTPYAIARSAVLSDLQALNATSANTLRQNILYRAAVAVDPAFGRWGLNSAGPSVFAPAVPPTTDILSTTASATTPANYR